METNKKPAPSCIQLNDHAFLDKEVENYKDMAWVTKPTAILVIHGMGNQRPLETLEQFGKTLIKTYQWGMPGKEFIIEHFLEEKSAGEGETDWYDNKLRIKVADDPDNYIDLYEYYWANHTEGKADWNDINDWIQGIVSGAWKYYDRNMRMAEEAKDESIMVKNKEDKWDIKYYVIIAIMGHLVMLLRLLGHLVKSLLNYIPVIGTAIAGILDSFVGKTTKIISNVMVDLVAYSVTDAKNKYYPVRRAILDGSVKALKYLLEKGIKREVNGAIIKGKRTYQRVIVAGHSLGSQVGYDAINRINLMINHCKIAGYDQSGKCAVQAGNKIDQQLTGFITFGSPLDKTAFFLRENIPENEYVRQQLLNDFLGFKQRDWTSYLNDQPGYFKVVNKATPDRLLEKIQWRNYYDKRDYVSGALDYYSEVTNVDCMFQASWNSFTHSNYWTHSPFYKDIIKNFLK